MTTTGQAAALSTELELTIMTPSEYLEAVLKGQDLTVGGAELTALQSARADVEKALRSAFPGTTPTIRYGASKAKGTMILDDYDLDIICYFEADETYAGKTLKEIYGNVRSGLEKRYQVRPRTTALRLLDKEGGDFHIDVIPGRFTDGTKGDAFLHQHGGPKDYLKTNLQTHIDHVAGSGCTDMIRLMKLLRCRNGLAIRTFALELLLIEVLKGSTAKGLEGRLTTLLTALRDDIESYKIEDPANPYGNDLSELLDDTVRNSLSVMSRGVLLSVEASGWYAVFGSVEKQATFPRVEALRTAAAQIPSPTRPWSTGA
jgi:hypothetical protein